MLKTALIVLGTLYLAIALFMFFSQRALMYFPDPQRTDPKSIGLDEVQERIIDTDEGARVIAWYVPARPGNPTLLYFHGNAGSLETRSERIRKYAARGRGIYMMSYRGYAGSTGKPSEAANVADAKRAYDDLVSLGVSADEIIVYGESLGSGVAVQVAADKHAAGLILDAPYTSIVDVAASQYPWLPVRPMLLDRYESTRYIASVRAPLLIVHGENDEVIPVAMGRALFKKANEPKTLAVLPGAGHADHYMFGSYEAINAWLDKLRARR